MFSYDFSSVSSEVGIAKLGGGGSIFQRLTMGKNCSQVWKYIIGGYLPLTTSGPWRYKTEVNIRVFRKVSNCKHSRRLHNHRQIEFAAVFS